MPDGRRAHGSVTTRLRGVLTYANVMATIGVFVALAGTSYAVASGSIGSRELRNNSVRSKDIRNHDIRTGDVRNGSLLAEDFKTGQLPAGPAGADGDPGKAGAPGKDGAPGATNVVVRTQEPCEDLPSGVHCAIRVECQPGERATGGGAGFKDFGGNEVLNVSHPVEADRTLPEPGDTPTGWAAGIEFSGGGPRDPIGYVICASP